MLIYLKIVQFSFLRFFTYPLEIIATVIKRFAATIFIALLWITIKLSGDNNIDITQIISYYLIASGISEIVMAKYGDFGKKLGKMIKTGDINTIMIKPINVPLYVYSISIGECGVRILISLVFVGIGLLVSPPKSIFSLLSLLIFTILAIINAFAFNLLEGVLFIYSTEATSFKNTINHVKGILGGLMVPIYLFPEGIIKTLIELSPFPALIYLPSYAIKFTQIDPLFIRYFLTSLFWALFLNFFIYKLWIKALKKYEAIGI